MASEFKEDFIDLRLPQRGVVRITLSELNYHSDVVEANIIVPIGFETDLGSIPNFLHWLFPKDGRAVLAYILHDYLYKTGMFSKSLSDEILEEAMEVLEAKWWRRKGVSIGLKLGGWIAYNKHRRGNYDGNVCHIR